MEHFFWTSVLDTTVVNATHMNFTVHGTPLASERPRFGRTGTVYSPSGRMVRLFRDAVTTLPQVQAMNRPVFQNGVCLVMTVVYHLQRPKTHFVSNDPSRPLKANAPPPVTVTRKDIDNLAKFTLDALQGCAYVNDKQVTSLLVVKIYDTSCEGTGRTAVLIQSVTQGQVGTLLQAVADQVAALQSHM
jgi:Holliday junction resolvase RusA-like endonuclease